MKLKNTLGAGLLAAVSSLSAAECPIGNYKSAIVNEINAIRSKPQVCGGVAYPAVHALTWNKPLESAATAHSVDMAAHDFLEHVGSQGQSIGDSARSAAYVYQSIGENIAAGPSTARQVSAGWLASAGHCATMMTASFKDMGVSCQHNPSSEYQYYWTLVLGNR